MNEELAAELLWVLVERPGPGSAEFLGRWLLAAADADKELHEQHGRNPSLKQRIGRLEVAYIVEFSPPATQFIELYMQHSTCFTLALWGEWGELFTLMVELGFFSETGRRYQMTVPNIISGLMIEAALLRLASTEDDEHSLHPENIVFCISKTEAEACLEAKGCGPSNSARLELTATVTSGEDSFDFFDL